MSMKELRKAAKKRKDEFENGTVVRWTAAGVYTYAAIKTPVGWFTTANNNAYTPNVLRTFDDLLKVIARSETSNVAVATAWTPVD